MKNLTDSQRLILYNQYEILKRLDPEYKKEYEEFQSILISGYTCLYDMFFGANNFEKEIEEGEENYRSMVNILNMYRHFDLTKRDTCDKNTKNLIEEQNYYFKFQGFDPHYDVRWGLLCSLKNLGKWKEVPEDFDSHGSNPNYNEMLIKYNHVINKQKENSKSSFTLYNPLSYDELLYILPLHIQEEIKNKK